MNGTYEQYLFYYLDFVVIENNISFQTRDELRDALDGEMRAFDMDKVYFLISILKIGDFFSICILVCIV